MSKEEIDRRAINLAIQRVLAGNENAYEVVYNLADARLRAYVGKRYGRLGDDFIKDVVNRAHERAFRLLIRYNPKKPFMTWLIWQARAAASEALEERFDRRERALTEGLVVEYFPSTTDPARDFERNERSRVLGEELNALSEQGRLTIAYHDMGGWTFDATARELGMTVPQVRYSRDKALAELRKRVERRGIRPVEVVPTYGRVYLQPGDLDEEEDATGRVAAVQPDEPRPRAGADDKEQRRGVT